ncbi:MULTISPECIES: hypothetical protein [unclassified Gilliamella]|uniref:hypothetical protein n=1 Tax=unclassified Gilliamella TaxID=2685620 RepID=UPI00130D45E6|nr:MULTISPECIES: hypothetical protein [unclassified Gilliamella]MWP49827.1 hypothetical protein [Gilliamella sp. Lep-s35]MWP69690.1 hypothetical protein [Gilliamella sp. Lep-s5]MWP77840.1 hypothetical protein [Gilliamella sp. Lep-s21]
MMKKIKYCLLLAYSLTLVGCSEPSSIERWIDNPTNNEIKVAIDGNELTIPAKSGVNYTFEYGKHTLSYNDDNFNFVVKPAQFGDSGLVNPTQSNYFLYTAIYSTTDISDEEATKILKSKKEINNIPVIINGEEFEIEVSAKLINDVLIEKSNYHWDYSYDQPFPEEITQNLRLKKKQSYHERLKKLYRESDFIEYLKGDSGEEKIGFTYNPKKFSNINQYVIPNIDLNSIKCKEGRQYMESLLNDWNHLLTLKGSDFTKPYNNLASNDAMAKSYNTESQCTKENDPEQTYSKVLRPFIDALRDTRDVNFYVIK